MPRINIGGLTFTCICCFLWSHKGEGCGEGRQNNVLPQRTTEDVMEPKERRTKRNWGKKRSFPWREADLGLSASEEKQSVAETSEKLEPETKL